jgi:hypothetical protein
MFLGYVRYATHRELFLQIRAGRGDGLSWRAVAFRLRAARRMPPVISTIVMLKLFARRQRASMSAYFTIIDTAKRPWPTSVVPRGGFPFGRAARGSVAPRKMACRSAAGGGVSERRFKAIDSR